MNLSIFFSYFFCSESDFALRPFSASLQHPNHHNHHHTNSRRQDGFMAPIGTADGGIGIHPPPIVRHHPHHQSTLTSTSISGASSLYDEPDFGILTAPVPRGSGSNPRPSFQRIRLTNPNSAQSQKPPPSLSSISLSMPQQHTSRQIHPPKQTIGSPFVLPDEFVPVTLTESPAPNFHRLVGLPSTSGRIPQSPAPLPPPPPPPQPVPISIPSSQPQRQSFRRIKPPTHGNWRGSKPKTPTTIQPPPPPPPPPAISIEPSQVRPNAGRVPISSNIPIIAASDKLIGRGPITGAQDDDLSHKPNALDNEDHDSGINIDHDRSSSFYGNRVSPPSNTNDDNGILVIESLSRNSNLFEPIRTRTALNFGPQSTPTISTAVVPTPTIPLTYYTTYTYYTTVVRGPHTAMLSREQVSSSTQLKPIDRNIVTAIEFSDGYIQPTSPTKMLLGTKTKGATTTIYNVASRIQVFNDDLYKVIFATNSKMIPRPSPTSLAAAVSGPVSSHRITPTRVQITPILLESTKIMTRHPPIQNNKPVTVRLEQLQKQVKKQLSLLTYYYTLIDGTQTQYSTRVEESSTNYNGDLQTLLPSMAPTIDSYGLLKIIQPNSIVPLGSRANGGSTTIVNLALNNYIQFSRIKDAQVDIVPTSSLSPSSRIQATRLSTISSSMEPEEPETLRETAKLGSTNIYLDTSIPTPSLSLSSTPTIIEPNESTSTTSTRSRTPSSPRRPGIRIKLKPSRSKIVNQISRLPSTVETSEQIQPTEDSTTLYNNNMLTPTIVDQTPVLSTTVDSSNEEDSPTSSSRKKVSFTLRRPGSSGGVNRFFSRRPSTNLFNQPSSSTRFTSPDITNIQPSLASSIMSSLIESTMSIYPPEVSSSPASIVSSTPSLPSQIDSSSSLDNWSAIFVQPSPSPSPVWQPSSSQSSLSPTPASRINKSRLVVLTRLAGAVNKWSPMYNNRIRVSSRRLIKSSHPLTSMMTESSSMEPASHETVVYETTTRTVPFNLGPTATYIIEEVTNTRVVDSMEDTLTPSIEDITRIVPQDSSDSTILSSPTPELSITQSLSSNKPSIARTYVVVETSDILTTSTLYSTYTYFATLFNGTQTSITPLEEIKTEYLTLREPILITKTIVPTAQFTPTNAVVLPSQTPSSSSSEASTISIGSSISDSSDDHDNNFNDITRLVTETYSTQTTLTHFITLFSGSHTILSSIEEISPTVMTRTRYVTPYTLLSSNINSQHVNVMINSNTMATTSSTSYHNLPSLTTEYNDDTTTTTTTSNDLMITDNLPTDRPSPSQPLTTPGSISYEIGPLDQNDFIMVKQHDHRKPVPNRTLSDQQQSTTTTTNAVLESGSVIELEDLLDGVHDAGPIGETIKDIVKDIFIKDDDGDTAAITTTTTTSPINDGQRQPDTTTIAPSTSPTAKATPSLNRYPMYLSPPLQKSSKYYDSSRDNNVIFSTQSDDTNKPTVSTRYVTSIEKSIRTLTLTSTKVREKHYHYHHSFRSLLLISINYFFSANLFICLSRPHDKNQVYYTRDSPLTITSVLTTTLPPITYVSTIIGSKTILGTYNSITPTKTTIMDSSTTTQTVSNMPSINIASSPSSSTTTVSSTVSPSTRPRLHRPKLANDMLNKAKVAPIFNTGGKTISKSNGNTQQQPNLVRNNHTTNVTITVDHLQLCDPACNVTNKEYCRESDIPNLYTCECRPGYVRRPSDNLCQGNGCFALTIFNETNIHTFYLFIFIHNRNNIQFILHGRNQKLFGHCTRVENC